MVARLCRGRSPDDAVAVHGKPVGQPNDLEAERALAGDGERVDQLGARPNSHPAGTVHLRRPGERVERCEVGGRHFADHTDPAPEHLRCDDAAHPVTVRNLADVVDTDVPGGRLITATVASAGDYRLSVRRVDVASPKGVAPLRPSFTGRPPTSSPPPPSADHHWLKSLPGDH
ncbi:MAG: hypothetical protein IPF42_02695 [Candidatus Microthrix sp.]|nr:hypothetical protein [Candidatus Microthrix sp.]